DHLGSVALLTGDLVEGDLVDLRGDGAVDVLPFAESGDEGRVLREVREDAQLDLRVVGGDERAPRRGVERAPDLAPNVGADRDVLKVRIGRREASRRG